METQFQQRFRCLLGPDIQLRMLHELIGSQTSNMASFKPEVLASSSHFVDKLGTRFQ